MIISQAITGFLLSRSGDSKGDLSPQTIRLYRQLLQAFAEWVGDIDVTNVTPKLLSSYMRYLDNDYRQSNGKRLSSSARDNYWKSLRSFFGWAAVEFGINRPDLGLKRPTVVSDDIVPYTQNQIKTILDYCEYTRPAKGKISYRMRRSTGLRDRAVVLLLLETGIRIGELCRLQMRDVDIDAGEIHIQPYHSSVKSKPRTIPIEKSTRQVLWRYRAKHCEGADWEDLFFKLNTRTLTSIFRRMSERTGIADVHAHRFRHTFATEYLRNGGDVFTLQRLLGHSSLEMTKRYLEIVKADLKNAHRRASPVEKWRL